MDIIQTPTHASNIHGKVKRIKYIILHGSGRSKEATDKNELDYLTKHQNIYTYHAYVFTTGEIHQLAPWDSLLWHVGQSKWREDTWLNDDSIGVAFSSTEKPDFVFSDEQVSSMRFLVKHLVDKFGVPVDNVLSHKEVSDPPGRKVDPVGFDMDKFRRSLLEPEPIPTYRLFNRVTNEQTGVLVGRVVGDKIYYDSIEIKAS